MSKMGISDVASYCGAQIFDAIGLAPEVVDRCFAGTPSPVGGIGFAELERETRARHAAAHGGEAAAREPRLRQVPQGRRAARDDARRRRGAARARRRARAAQGGDDEGGRAPTSASPRSSTAARRSSCATCSSSSRPAEPVPLDEVEPVEAIVRRFSSGAMSHGALSAEAHETIAIALNRLGAHGRTPARAARTRRASATERNSPDQAGRVGPLRRHARVRGVRARSSRSRSRRARSRARAASCPGHKVTAEIARLRHTQPGVALISPPPHHDIYSIEDLAQLIFDLRQVNPRRGGLGEARRRGRRRARRRRRRQGARRRRPHRRRRRRHRREPARRRSRTRALPWELGLAETQQALVANGLRGRVRLRVDGGFKTGRDVVVAALLGADEVSLRHRAPARRGLPDGALVPRRHVPGRHRDPAARAAREVRGDAGAGRGLPAVRRRGGAAAARLARAARRSTRPSGASTCLRQRRTGDARADALDLDAAARAPARAGRPLRGRAAARGGAAASSASGSLADAAAGARGRQPRRARVPDQHRDRTVGARLGGAIGGRFGSEPPPGRIRARFEGSAGQSFGAFLAAGVELDLDGRGERLRRQGHGRRPHRRPAAGGRRGRPVLVGNTVLYGATGGELFCAGRAGERFAVRNSGAVAVVEGVGDHPCEYMTSGTVVVLGATRPQPRRRHDRRRGLRLRPDGASRRSA